MGILYKIRGTAADVGIKINVLLTAHILVAGKDKVQMFMIA